VVAAIAVVMIPAHYLATRLTFFGAEAVIHEEDVRVYWMLVAALVSGVVASLWGALWRGGRKSFAWHVLVAIVGLAVASALSVTEAGAVDDVERDGSPEQHQPRNPGHSVCLSGGDNDECVGG
jgi:hypothetical protein